MIGIVLVTHGRLASEFQAALEHVVGPQRNIEAIDIGPDDDVEQRRRDIIDAVAKVETGDGVAVLTDMFGGTPSNLAISVMNGPSIEVVAGINLPMLVKLARVRAELAPRRGRGTGAGGRPEIYQHREQGLIGTMIRRSAYPETANAASAATLEAGFVNPWAECWGSGVLVAAGNRTDRKRFASRRPTGWKMQSDDARSCLRGASAGPRMTEGSLVRVLPVINHKGLHARASARFVQTVEGFDADVRVTRCGETVGGLSIMGLMMLAAARGTTITVETSGDEAQACMEAIEALLADKFGEEC